MRMRFGVRQWAAAGAAMGVAALLIAYFFMERYLLLQPCPLCILDRFAVAGLVLGFLGMAFFFRHRWICWGCLAANSVCLTLGFVFAGRHIWLQNQPLNATGECLSDSAAAVRLTDLVAQAFDAGADCGMISWEFVGLTIPEQVLILFAAFLLIHLMLLVKMAKR